MSQILTDIALIKQKAEFNEEKLDQIMADLAVVSANLNTNELVRKKDLDDHAIQDRWMFGIVGTLLIFILGKLIIG